jgi:hypothetical protein
MTTLSLSLKNIFKTDTIKLISKDARKAIQKDETSNPGMIPEMKYRMNPLIMKYKSPKVSINKGNVKNISITLNTGPRTPRTKLVNNKEPRESA